MCVVKEIAVYCTSCRDHFTPIVNLPVLCEAAKGRKTWTLGGCGRIDMACHQSRIRIPSDYHFPHKSTWEGFRVLAQNGAENSGQYRLALREYALGALFHNWNQEVEELIFNPLDTLNKRWMAEYGRSREYESVHPDAESRDNVEELGAQLLWHDCWQPRCEQ